MKRRDLIDLVKSKGQRYSDILSIDVNSDKDREVFKWFLASILFGAPTTESSVIKTHRCFEKHRILTPEEIVEAKWKGLVEILDE